MLPDNHPEIDPSLANAIHDVVVREVDEETARQHLAAIVVQAGKVAAAPAHCLPRRDRRRKWRAALGAAVATFLMPVGLTFAGVPLPELVEQPYRAVGIPLPADRTDPPAPPVTPPAGRDDIRDAEREVVAPVSPNGSDRRVQGKRATRRERRSGAPASGRESRAARSGAHDANGRTGQQRSRRRVTPQRRSDASETPSRSRQPAPGTERRPAKPQPVPRGTSGRTGASPLSGRHSQEQERTHSPAGRAPKAATSPDPRGPQTTSVAAAEQGATADPTNARRNVR